MPLDPSIQFKANNSEPQKLSDMMKDQAVLATAQQGLEKGNLETTLLKQKALNNVIASVTDQPSYDRAIQWAYQNGLGDQAKMLGPTYDKKVVDSVAWRGMDAEKRMELQFKDRQQTETERHNKVSEASKGSGGGITVDPETGDLTFSGGGGASGFGKAPTGYRFTNTGDLQPIAGGPAEKQTAQQAAQEALLDQSVKNLPNIRKVMATISPVSAADWMRDAGEVGEAKRQLRAGVEAALRTMSGAAVPETEVQRYSDLFAPRFDDSPQTKQKKLNELEKFMTSASSGMKTGRVAPSYGSRLDESIPSGAVPEKLMNAIGNTPAGRALGSSVQPDPQSIVDELRRRGVIK